MNISTRFPVAIHILCALAIGKDKNAVCTSERIASSVNTNAVVIRRVTGMLKRAGLVDVNLGQGGTVLLRPIKNITLLDVYRAVDTVNKGSLFKTHENTNSNCIVGANILDVLKPMLKKAEASMEDVLAGFTIDDVIAGILKTCQSKL